MDELLDFHQILTKKLKIQFLVIKIMENRFHAVNTLL